ncbi:MAG: DUF3089 domain-containing protein, partial [Steroidobacteraceae bacterium]
MNRRFTLPVLAGLMMTTAAMAQTPPSAPDTQPANDYSKAETWLCRPGRKDACAADQSTIIVTADGKLTTEPFNANPAAAIDCFYVYPTVSLDATGNSDMTAGPEELAAISSQFARFGSKCRTYAPLYRQGTLVCVITYASFRSTAPPPPDGRLGKAADPMMQAACTNPAALGGGSAE